MPKDLSKLQNGSDIRGISLTGVQGEEVNLGKDEAASIGAAFVSWLSDRSGKDPSALRICIGHDPRLSHDFLSQGLMSGISYMKAGIGSAGLASTPAMFMSTVMDGLEFDGAIMITASHLPFNRNGFKFFTAEGGLNKEDITAILDKAAGMNIAESEPGYEEVALMDMYAAHLRSLIETKLGSDLTGLKVIVDAGNGSGGFFARDVLAPLGADVSDSLYLEPDGTFPNHQPNPENAEAMAAICEAVREKGADIGIIFDTDVDRSAAVTPGGEPISRNEIVALTAALLSPDHAGGTIVTDSVTSNELHDFLEKDLGLIHFRYKRGYRNVINKAIELARDGADAFLAIETSGHAAFAENYWLDDGAYLAVLIVVAAARLKRGGAQDGGTAGAGDEGQDAPRGIESLIAGLGRPAESLEIRFKLDPENYKEIGTRILEDMPKWVDRMAALTLEEPNYEGVRVNFEFGADDEALASASVDAAPSNGASSASDASSAQHSKSPLTCRGWFLLRKSLHDPVLPLNIESSMEGGCEAVAVMISKFLSQYEGIDL
jgi:phosphomannomutase